MARKQGWLDGESVDLDQLNKIPKSRWPEIEVEQEDGTRVRPYRFVGDGDDVRVSDDGTLIL